MDKEKEKVEEGKEDGKSTLWIKTAFPKLWSADPWGSVKLWQGSAENGEIIVFLKNLAQKMCKLLYTVTSKNLLLKSFLFLFVNTSSEAYYSLICCHSTLAIGSEENSVAFYLWSEMDSYYFSLATWNSITKGYPQN